MFFCSAIFAHAQESGARGIGRSAASSADVTGNTEITLADSGPIHAARTFAFADSASEWFATYQMPPGGAAAPPSPVQEFPSTSFAGSTGPTAPRAAAAQKRSKSKQSQFGVGIGIKASTLGIGGEVAVSLARRLNLRAGFNQFNYNHAFLQDGTTYTGALHLQSVEFICDLFPFAGGFHISPGMLTYNGNNVSGNATVPAGQTFTLNNVNYISSPVDPVKGTGSLPFNSKVAPMILVGWGNLAKHHGHISVPFEAGLVFQGSPVAALNLGGSVCDSTGVNCRKIAGDPTAQANVTAEQTKINNSIVAFKYYPIISLGFGYRF